MIITYADIESFKNISGISFEPDPKYNIIIGRNAQGKTNLLEALWMLSGCKSFRGSKEKECIPLGGKKMSCRIRLNDGSRDQKLSYDIIREGNSNKKRITVNGVPQKSTRALFEVFKCISFTPDDVNIIKGTPEKRRSFIDLAASQLNPILTVHVTKLYKIIENRNSVLRNINSGIIRDNEALVTYDSMLSRIGSLVSFMRYDYIARLNEVCEKLYKTISGGKEKLELEYRSNIFDKQDFENGCGPEAYEKYSAKLIESRESDILTSSTRFGVNRDEITVRIDGISAKEYASQGQIKSAALVIKLAQAEIYKSRCKESPVVFLDDVMGELDENRQRFVLDMVKNMQVFITTPNAGALLPEIKGKVMTISGGRIEE